MRSIILVGVLTLASTGLYADTIWGEAIVGAGRHFHLLAINTITGNVFKNFLLPGKSYGVVQVGNVLYATTADNNVVEKIDATTGADLGAAFSVAGASGLSAMAWDGADFWIADDSGTNRAFHYTPTGTLLKTITLADCTMDCNGLEFFQGKLISNESLGLAPGIYDVYDTDGNLLVHSLIKTGFLDSLRLIGAGIAFNGTDFYVSSPPTRTIGVYDTSGNFIRRFTVHGPAAFGIEDLSFNHNYVPNTPEPATGFLLLGGFAMLGLLRRKRA